MSRANRPSCHHSPGSTLTLTMTPGGASMRTRRLMMMSVSLPPLLLAGGSVQAAFRTSGECANLSRSTGPPTPLTLPLSVCCHSHHDGHVAVGQDGLSV